MSKNYAIIIHFMLPLTTFYRSGAHRSDVYKWDAFVTSWRFYNRAWQPQRHDRLSETSGTLWIHRGALTNQRCSLATGCGISLQNSSRHVLGPPSVSRPGQASQCPANHRPGYWSNLLRDRPSTTQAPPPPPPRARDKKRAPVSKSLQAQMVPFRHIV